MNNKLLLSVVSTLALSGSVALAVPAAPTDTTVFGSLPAAATFGGTGIPNSPAEVTTITGLSDGDQITLGLLATPYGPGAGTPLPNSNGTYYPAPGLSPANSARSTWNFDWYINVADGTGSVSDYTFKLLYALVPGASPTGVINLSTWGDYQDSENLMFGFFHTGATGVTPPSGGPFDPNATGDYDFVLEAFSGTGDAQKLIGSSDITVDVQTVPDAGSTALLMAGALGGLMAFRSKQLRRQKIA